MVCCLGVSVLITLKEQYVTHELYYIIKRAFIVMIISGSSEMKEPCFTEKLASQTKALQPVCSLVRFPLCVAVFVYVLACLFQANWPSSTACCSHVSIKQTGSSERVLDSTRPKKPRPLLKKLHDQSRAKTLVNMGVTFEDFTEIIKCNSWDFLGARMI